MTTGSAHFNSNRSHRFWLERIWDADKPAAMVIGLNPSTANESDNDPTIESAIRILRNNGYGKLIMVNLFTYVSADPKELKNPATCTYDLKQCVKIWKAKYMECQAVVFAWGAFETHGRDNEAIKCFGPIAWCLGKNQNGSPKHPLYQKADTQLQYFQRNQVPA